MKYVYVDLDETLIHTRISSKNPGENALKLSGDKNYYSANLRGGAHELLKEIRKAVSSENVFMLTASIHDYARHFNRVFEFGFAEDQIFDRESISKHIYSSDGGHSLKADPYHTRAFLIDNLSSRDNYDKLRFIKIRTGVHPKYIQISEYFRSPDDDLTRYEINNILGQLG